MMWSVVLPLAMGVSLVALLGGLALRSSAAIEWRELQFPDDLKTDRVVAVVRHIAGVRQGPVSITVVASDRRIRFFIGAPSLGLNSVMAASGGLVTKGRFEEAEPPVDNRCKGSVVGARVDWAGRWPILRTEDPQLTSAALLGVMASVRRGERIELRLRLWPAGRVDRPVASSERRRQQANPWLMRALWPAEPPREEVRLIRAKYSDLVVRAEVLISSSAGTIPLAVANAERVIAALRTSGGLRGVLRYRGVYGQGRVTRMLDRRRQPLPWERQTLLSAEEVAGLACWPIDAPPIPGISYGVGPRLAPPLDLPKRGRVFAISNFPSTEGQPLAQPVSGGLQHVLTVGPTGSGKSTLVSSLIRADMVDGRGAFVLDLKGDLVEDLLALVPANRIDDVVVLEPSRGGAQPGLRLFARDGDPELTSDLILGTLAELFRDSWGIRSSQYLGLGLKTLAAVPGSTLVDLPALFTDERFRARLLKHLTDPWIRSAWTRFLSLSASERTVHVSSPLTKLEELVGRGRLRLVLGQSHSKLDFHEVLSRGQIVLVSLPPGLLGTPATRLLSALTLWQFFQAVEARAAISREKRSPYFAYVDELGVLSDLPLPIESILERARGHGCGLALSPQALSQLTPSLRSSVLANVGSLVSFQQTSEEEARVVARAMPGVDASQLQHLGRYEVAMRLSLGPGLITPTMTGATLPVGAAVSDPEDVRRRSGELWGQTLSAIEDELARRHGLAGTGGAEPEGHEPGSLGGRRRQS
jgi:hypothetical protein